MTTPAPARTSFARLDAVACTTVRACMAVGADQVGSGPVTPLVEQLTAGRWRIRAARDPAGTNPTELRSVFCDRPDDCLAVGGATASSTGRMSPLAERWNGSRWRLLKAFRPAGSTFSVLSAVTCVAPTKCLAAGTTQSGSAAAHALIELWNGTVWRG